jgi:two-component system response regulator FixJ
MTNTDTASPLVHLVDDDDGVRAGLALLLASVGLRSRGWADPQAFLDGFDREALGAIVLDVRMPGLSGLGVLDRLHAQGVDLPVLLLTGHATVEMCRRAFKAGAIEFLEKPVDDERLIEAVLEAVRRHVRTRHRDAADREARERFARLSPREREVLGQVVDGRTNKEIARALGLSPRTVETHRTHLAQKLETGSLAQLVRRYAALLDEPAP